eukprot:6014469-Prymnesium_polylepis.1
MANSSSSSADAARACCSASKCAPLRLARMAEHSVCASASAQSATGSASNGRLSIPVLPSRSSVSPCSYAQRSSCGRSALGRLVTCTTAACCSWRARMARRAARPSCAHKLRIMSEAPSPCAHLSHATHAGLDSQPESGVS